MNQHNKIRIGLGIFSIVGLITVFLFQRTDVSAMLNVENEYWKFVINRSIRFIINDTLTILLIYALFSEGKYVVFAFWVQLIGLVFVLMPYFVLKFYFSGYNGPLVSFLHRLVLNPTLLLLLIPAFYYQKNTT